MLLLERARAWLALRHYASLTPRSREGSFVRATGIVRALDETVIAPLAGCECVFVRSRIRGTGYVGGPPELLQIRPFVIDAEIPVVVDGSDALLGIDEVPPRSVSVERRTAFVARFGLKPPGTAWLEEILIAAGDRITVGGVLLHDLNPEPPTSERTFRQRVKPQLRLVGSVEHPLVIVGRR